MCNGLPDSVVMILFRPKNTTDWAVWDISQSEKSALGTIKLLQQAWPDNEYAILTYIKGKNTLVRI
jgi:hypothetical protein